MDDPSLGEALDLLTAGPSYPSPPSFSTDKFKPKSEVANRPLDIDSARLQMVRPAPRLSLTTQAPLTHARLPSFAPRCRH